MFNKFKKDLQAHIALLITHSRQRLYVTNADKDVLWNTYLTSFPEEERQGHNCNA